MTNKEFRQILEMTISTCEWALEQQNNPRAMANDIIFKAQQNNIEKMKQILKDAPKEGISTMAWIGFGPPPENYVHMDDWRLSEEGKKAKKEAEKRDILREEDK